MKRILYVIMLMFLVLAVGCKNNVEKASEGEAQPQVVKSEAGISGTVTETMDASGYTYIEIDTGSEKVWAAGPKTVVKVGDEVFVPEGSPIQGFESKTLGRTFESIVFATSIMVGGADQPFDAASQKAPADHTKVAPGVVTDFSDVTKAEGGKTVEEVYAQRAELNAKEVLVRGKVVKYMSGIMGKNWLHVKDGTGSQGTDDLVVTTMETAAVGDKVLVKGVVASDKDFGSGYRYDVIVEEAEVTVE